VSQTSSDIGQLIWCSRASKNNELKILLWKQAMLASLKRNLLPITLFLVMALSIVLYLIVRNPAVLGQYVPLYVGAVCLISYWFLDAEKAKLASLASDMFGGAGDMHRIHLACEAEIKKKAESDVDRTAEITLAQKAKKYFYLYGGISYTSATLFKLLSPRKLSKWERTDLDVIGNIFSKRGSILRAKKFYDQIADLYLARNQGGCDPVEVASSYALACKWMYLAVARFNNQQAEVYRQNMKLVMVRYPDLPLETKLRLEEILEDDHAYKASQQQLVAKYVM
jgi:hypothetical protein